MASLDSTVTYRDRATLRAIACGRVEITCSCEPDFFVDGIPYCDQSGARYLIKRDLVEPVWAAQPGQRVRANLTPTGFAVLIEGDNSRSAA